MTRFKAAFVHLLLSLLVIGSFVLLILFIWYPKPLFSIAGVIEPLKLLVLIDVIIGPMLTFIIFNKAKSLKLLKIDLSIIVLVQLLAFAFGVYTIYKGRASIIVFTNGQFHYLSEKYANNQDLQYGELKPQFFSKPKLAYIPVSKSLDIYSEYGAMLPFSGNDLIAQHSLSIENMRAKFSGKIDQIDAMVSTYSNDEIAFLILDKDMSVNYIVYSKTRNLIIDELKF